MRVNPQIKGIFALAATVLLIWFFWNSTSIRLDQAGNRLLPAPSKVWAALWQLQNDPRFLRDFGETASRMVAGLAIASAIGIAAGVLLGLSAVLYRAIMPVFDFIRSVPISSLYPVFVLSAGIGQVSKIAMIATATIPIMVLHTAAGVSNRNRNRSDYLRLLGASKVKIVATTILPESLPQIWIGFEVAVSYSLIVTVLTEMFMGSDFGLGQRIMESYTTFSVDVMYAMVLVTGSFGYILHLLGKRLEQVLLNWK